MAISDSDKKLLWGKAAAFCSRPGCGADLTRGANDDAYILGEMAHIVAQSPSGPRGKAEKGEDTYENLLLLCPTCHSEIDKAPEKFSADILRSWKGRHEARIRELGSEKRFDRFEDLKGAIGSILSENYSIWKNFGPQSEAAQSNPLSNAHRIWELRRADRLVPNNLQIINIIRANEALISTEQRAAFGEFVVHAEAFAEHVHDRLDSYPLFPVSFSRMFGS